MTMIEDHFIELINVTKIYFQGENPVVALDHINVNISKGEFLAITGKSGCGKSTLINIIGGLDSPDQGRVMINGEDISTMNDRRLTLYRRDRVGIIFQFFNLLHLLREGSNPPGDKIESLLHEMDLYERRDHYPHELSGGEMQRVAICRALINDPEIILADEPTGNLDSASGKQVLDILGRLRDGQGKTVILVTHSQEGAAMADRVIRMRDGKLL
jgi:putative ABC transport system ATP-binding protein